MILIKIRSHQTKTLKVFIKFNNHDVQKIHLRVTLVYLKIIYILSLNSDLFSINNLINQIILKQNGYVNRMIHCYQYLNQVKLVHAIDMFDVIITVLKRNKMSSIPILYQMKIFGLV